MTIANVLHFENEALTIIGRRIDAAARSLRENDQTWVENSLEAALALHEARQRFSSHNQFGRWLAENQHDHFSHQDRAALIGLAADPELAREVLMQTESRSYQHIWAKTKNRFTHASKTVGREEHAAAVYDRLTADGRSFSRKDLAAEAGVSYGTAQRVFALRGKPEQPAKREAAPKLDRALSAYDDLERSGKPTTMETVARQAGVGKTTAEKALSIKRQAAAVQPLDPATVAPSTRERMEAWTRAERKRLRLLVEAELRPQYAHQEEEWFKHIWERVDWAEKVLDRHKGIMSKGDYQTIVKCLHPDTSADPELKAEAFRLFTRHRDVLIKPELKFAGPPLPSLGELLARRRVKA